MNHTCIKYILFFCTCCSNIGFTSQTDTLTIDFIDTNDAFYLAINEVKLKANSPIKDYIEIFGEPTRIDKQKKDKVKCGGLGGMCGTMIPIPKRQFFYFDQYGIEIVGENRKKILAIIVYFTHDQEGYLINNSFEGKLSINGNIVNPSTDLKEIKSTEGDENSFEIYNTLFKEYSSFDWKNIVTMHTLSKEVRINIDLNVNKEITRVIYYFD